MSTGSWETRTLAGVSSRTTRGILALAVTCIAIWFGGIWLARSGVVPIPWAIPPRAIVLDGEPQIGAAYRVTVHTHCGLRNVEFDGSRWAISGVLDDGNGNPPDWFANPTDTGSVTLTGPNTAIYLNSMGVQRDLTRGNGLPPVEGCL